MTIELNTVVEIVISYDVQRSITAVSTTNSGQEYHGAHTDRTVRKIGRGDGCMRESGVPYSGVCVITMMTVISNLVMVRHRQQPLRRQQLLSLLLMAQQQLNRHR